jgi:hypothetical protein
MKPETTMICLLATALLGAIACGCATSQARLEAQAKVSRSEAEKIALARVTGGTIKEGELEEERGKLVWSFEIATPGTADITEILVNAITGEVVATEKEAPAPQGKEEQEKPNEKANQSWKETLTAPDEPLAASGRNRFFILEPGYQLVFEGKEGGKTVNLTITVLDDTKQVAGVLTRVVEERESADGKPVETSRNYFAIGTRSRNVYYFGEDVDVFKGDKVVHEGAWLAGVNGAKHGILMPGEIKMGARYYQEQAPEVAMDRAENVSTNETAKTPAGSFEHCLKVKETTPLESGTEYKLYAPEVGLVQDGSLRLVKHGFAKN